MRALDADLCRRHKIRKQIERQSNVRIKDYLRFFPFSKPNILTVCHRPILDYSKVSIKFSYVDKIVFSLETKKI
jgi:hypothetical protein